MSENTIEAQPIPSVNAEVEKAGKLQSRVLMGMLFVGLALFAGAIFYGKSAIISAWSSMGGKKADKTKVEAGVAADAKPRDLQAAIGAAPAAPGAPAVAPQARSPGEVPKFDITYDANGNPQVVAAGAKSGKPGAGGKQAGRLVDVPRSGAAETVVRVVDRLDVPLMLTDATAAAASGGVVAGSGGMAGMTAQANSALGALGLGGGAGAGGGPAPMKTLDVNEVVQQYLNKSAASAKAAPGAGLAGGSSGGVGASGGAVAAVGSPSSVTSNTGPLAAQFVPSDMVTVAATQLPNLNLVWPKGAGTDCVLDGAIDASSSGYVSCTVSNNVYGANGNVLLVEKGSKGFLEYRAVTGAGQTRFPLIASSIRTATGVTFNIASGAQGLLGETGASGYTDNRWGERLGAAMLIATIGDGFTYLTAKNSAPGSSTSQYAQSQGVAQSIPSKILDSTVNIKPMILKLQGETVRIVAVRDVDFSSVYKLMRN